MEIKEPLVKDIMTTSLIRYDKTYENDLKKMCRNLKISYLPDLKGEKFYKYDENDERFIIIDAKQVEEKKIPMYLNVFDEKIINKFNNSKKNEEDAILFVFEGDRFEGIIHFYDYNKEPVFVYLYHKIISFESNVRILLENYGKTNEDVIEFIKIASKNNNYYKNKYKEINNNKEKIKSLGEFQIFYLTDLIEYINYNKKEFFKISNSDKIIDFRNIIMHFKYFVEKENGANSYNFDSFTNFIKKYDIFINTFNKVENLIKIKSNKLI